MHKQTVQVCMSTWSLHHSLRAIVPLVSFRIASFRSLFSALMAPVARQPGSFGNSNHSCSNAMQPWHVVRKCCCCSSDTGGWSMVSCVPMKGTCGMPQIFRGHTIRIAVRHTSFYLSMISSPNGALYFTDCQGRGAMYLPAFCCS